MLLGNTTVHQSAQSIGRIWVAIERLLIGLRRIAVFFLNQFQISHLDVTELALWGNFNTLVDVGIGGRKLFAINFSNRTQGIALRRRRLQSDELRGRLRES